VAKKKKMPPKLTEEEKARRAEDAARKKAIAASKKATSAAKKAADAALLVAAVPCMFGIPLSVDNIKVVWRLTQPLNSALKLTAKKTAAKEKAAPPTASEGVIDDERDDFEVTLDGLPMFLPATSSVAASVAEPHTPLPVTVANNQVRLYLLVAFQIVASQNATKQRT
jgi:hypothetical protein